ncbi:MAG: DUF2147 domain-containing protein [Pseudooceanicola sp.]
MRKLASGAVVWVMMAGMALADPVFGTWRSEPLDNGDSGTVIFSQCGAHICGRIGQSFHADGKAFKSKNTGKNVVWDMSPNGGGKYSGGKIWDPAKDKVYKSKMKLSGKSLKVSGCIGPICRGQTWQRVK